MNVVRQISICGSLVNRRRYRDNEIARIYTPPEPCGPMLTVLVGPPIEFDVDAVPLE
jgi:hypothetical protein